MKNKEHQSRYIKKGAEGIFINPSIPFLQLFFLITLYFISTTAFSDGPASGSLSCSSDNHTININEINMASTGGDVKFIEAKVLNNQTSPDPSNWEICYVSKHGNTACFDLISTDVDVYQNGTFINNSSGYTNFAINDYLVKELPGGAQVAEILIADENEDVIDYLQFCKSDCSTGYWTVADPDCGTVVENIGASVKDLARLTPDGTGAWTDTGDKDGTKGGSNSGASPVLDHYVINHDGFGIHCISETITVNAMDATPATINAEGISITIDTQSGKGDWSVATGAGVFDNGTAKDGVATYTFATGETEVSFNLSYQEGSSPININVTDGTASDDNSHSSLPFSPNGFTITSSAIGNPPSIPGPEFENQIAGTNSPFYITAYGVTPSDPVCGVIESYTGSKNLYFWSDYDNPSSGTLAVTINGSPIATSEGAASMQSYTFTQGQLTLNNFKYKDVGQISLSVKDISVTNTELPNGIRGSAQFIVKPDYFTLINIQCGDDTNNPAATNESESRFCKAGEPFSLTIEAKDAEGDITPNYGQESFPEGVKLSNADIPDLTGAPILIAPSGENNPMINELTADPFSSGISKPDISWQEVGIIQLTPRIADGDYLGAGDVIGNTSANIGRFYPFDFNVTLNNTPLNTPLLEAACNEFSYIGQNIDYNTTPEVTITARYSDGSANADGTTLNYDGDWWKLSDFTETASQDLSIPLVPQVTLDGSNAGHDAIDCSTGTCNGTFTTTFNGYFNYIRTNSDIEPFASLIDISFEIDDGDAQYTSNPFIIEDLTFSATFDEQRSGRLMIDNAYGSELIDLTQPLYTEYYTSGGFIRNEQDNCTQINVADMSLTDNPAGGSYAPAESIVNTPASSGELNILFTAPGVVGYTDVQLNAADVGNWLLYDWDNDGSYDDAPSGRASFGIYNRSKHLIYTREVY